MPRVLAPQPSQDRIWQTILAARELARKVPLERPDDRGLIQFASEVSRGRWYAPRHLRLLCEKLEAVERGEIHRLIIELPPRHGKSETASVWFPTWYLNRHPEKRVVLASYELGFAAGWGRRVRNNIIENPEEMRVRIASDSAAQARWNTTAGGGMVTAGIGGALTGRGADLLIIDDPIKNLRDANSPVVRDNVWGWWQSTALTRLEPDAAVIVIMTRWHVDDLVGRVLRQDEEEDDAPDDQEQWHRVTLPALAEVGDALGRAEGEALWPERYDETRLARRRSRLGEYVWDSLYQQRPTAPGGAVFRRPWFTNRYNAADPAIERKAVARYTTWDTANKDGEDDAWTVGCTFDLMPDYKLYLRHVERARLELPELVSTTKANAVRWNQDDKLSAIIIEDKASGIGLLQTLRSQAPPWMAQLLVPITPTADKLTRAKMASVWCDNGSVVLPEPSDAVPWLAQFERELFDFPQSAYADQVDAFAQGIIYLENIIAAGHQVREQQRDVVRIG